MSCSTCGSSAPCGCVNTAVGRTCRCGNPTCCGTCGCNAPLPATPLPFYACAPVCPESHTQKVVLQQFYTTISVANTWNVPTCGAQATLSVLGLQSANPGSYIWNSAYGFFEIISFDISTGQLVVQNNCNDGNAAPGTNVPACTDFTITVPPCDCITSSTPCVAIDFTAPDVDTCLDITLTGTTGLVVGFDIQIGSGIYRLSAIKANFVVTICNDGEGLIPGTPVIAKNAANQYQYCLGIIETSPCTSAAALMGNIVVCKTGVQKPLEAVVFGGGLVVVPALDGTDNEEVQFEALDANARTCCLLTSDLHIVSGTSAYTIAVDNTAGLVMGVVIQIDSLTERFTIVAVGANSFDITANTVPGANATVSAGSWVCTITCCETLTDRLDAQPFLSQTAQHNDTGPFAAVTALNPTVNGSNFTFTITNPSATKTMNVMLIMRSIINGTGGADLGPPSAWAFGGNISYTLNGGGANVVGYRYSGFGSAAVEAIGPEPMDFYIVEHQTQAIAPGATLTVVAHPQVTFQTPDVGETSSYTPTNMFTSYSVLGIPG